MSAGLFERSTRLLGILGNARTRGDRQLDALFESKADDEALVCGACITGLLSVANDVSEHIARAHHSAPAALLEQR